MEAYVICLDDDDDDEEAMLLVSGCLTVLVFGVATDEGVLAATVADRYF